MTLNLAEISFVKSRPSVLYGANFYLFYMCVRLYIGLFLVMLAWRQNILCMLGCHEILAEADSW